MPNLNKLKQATERAIRTSSGLGGSMTVVNGTPFNATTVGNAGYRKIGRILDVKTATVVTASTGHSPAAGHANLSGRTLQAGQLEATVCTALAVDSGEVRVYFQAD